MHILLGILSTLTIGFLLVWRITNLLNAVQQTNEVWGGIYGKARRYFQRRKATPPPLSQIKDPREAALALMVAVMKDRGDLSEQQLEQLEKLAAARLNFENPQEMVTLARWHVKDFCESGAVLYRLAKPMAKMCTGSQRADIIDLVSIAARTGHGEMTQLQAHTIKELKYKFGDVSQQTHNAA